MLASEFEVCHYMKINKRTYLYKRTAPSFILKYVFRAYAQNNEQMYASC